MKTLLSSLPSQAEVIVHILIAMVILAVVMRVTLWLKKYLPHPEEVKIGTENIDQSFAIGPENFKVSDLVYYRKVGKSIDFCQKYLRLHNVEMLYKEHIDILLGNKIKVPEQWKRPYLGYPVRFLFIGLFMNLADHKFYIHYVAWDHKSNKLNRGTLPSDYKLKPGDLIVAARSRE